MKKKVALVLSGGGARGLAHIGVIEELERLGFEISSIAGTSMGAVVGGVYAAGRLEWYKTWLRTLDKLKVFNLFDFTLSKSGLIRGERVFRSMQKLIPDCKIEKLKIPFAAVTVDLISKKEIVITKGSLYRAMRASSAIPGFISPLRTRNQVLVDGGVINNVPVNAVKRRKGDLLVVVDVNADIPFRSPKSISSKEVASYNKKIRSFRQKANLLSNKKTTRLNYYRLLSRSMDIMMNSKADLLMKDSPPDLIIKIPKESGGIFDFYKTNQFIEIGRQAARRDLKKL